MGCEDRGRRKGRNRERKVIWVGERKVERQQEKGERDGKRRGLAKEECKDTREAERKVANTVVHN